MAGIGQEAADIVGVWTLMMMISVVIYSFPQKHSSPKAYPNISFSIS
ncbi:MAG: hypothetical protein ACLUE2_03135 [Bacteroides cellulosilyticus]